MSILRCSVVLDVCKSRAYFSLLCSIFVLSLFLDCSLCVFGVVSGKGVQLADGIVNFKVLLRE